MNCCDAYGNCRQGRDCPARLTSYKKSFDHLGRPIEKAGNDFRISDLLMLAFWALCIVAILTAVIK